MHSYLRAVGFSQIKTSEQLDKIIGMVMNQPTVEFSAQRDNKIKLCEISKDFGDRIGITLRGEYDEKGFFHLEHYFPYFKGRQISTQEAVAVNKKVEAEAYTGMCDDIRFGVSLIFYLQNAMDYTRITGNKDNQTFYVPVTLCGLSTKGIILLGVHELEANSNSDIDISRRNKWIAEAKKGNQQAIDYLAIEEIDLYDEITKRIKKEDIYSIVETSFIPYGSESDNYTVVGIIHDAVLTENQWTGEKIYDLLLDCNGMMFSICINEVDILGEPKPGRRFKGNIWMQGYLNFKY